MRTRWFNALTLLVLLLGMVSPQTALAGPAKVPPVTVPSSLDAQETSPAEIEQGLLDQLTVEDSADFVVVMAEQADLSAAYRVSDWHDRGRYVYDTLRKVAERTQAPVLAYAKRHGLAYQAFFTTNSVHIQRGTLRAAQDIALMPGVMIIRAPKVMQVDKAALEAQQAQATTSFGWNLDALEPDSGLYGMQAAQVWNQYGVRGNGIVVANIDTGVTYQHEALNRQYRGNLGSSYEHDFSWYAPTSDAAAQCGGDAATSPCDSDGHGSGTAGIMVGETADLTEQLGVAPAAEWIACMGCDLYGPGGAGGCSEAALTGCADWMVAPCPIGADPGDPSCDPDMRPNIVNNSWGGTGGDDWYRGYIQAWTAAGIFPAFSAGNTVGCAAVGSPGDNPEAFGTAAHNSTGQNLYAGGPSVFFPNPSCDPDAHEVDPHLNAPTYGRTASEVPGGYYNIGGTSGASPHTAGAVALIWSANPALIGDIDTTFTLLEQSADRSSTQPWREGTCDKPACAGADPYPNYCYGWGYLDALAAVDEAMAMADNGILAGTITETGTGTPIADAQVMATLSVTRSWQTTTDARGEYAIAVFSGAYTVDAWKYGYLPVQVTGVDVTTDMTTTLDLELPQATYYTVDGTVTDANTGWPLYAQIDIAGYPASPVWTDPETGAYSVDLAEGVDYVFTVSAWVDGYEPASRSVSALTADRTEDFALDAEASCTAPGYAFVDGVFQSFEGSFPPAAWTVVNNGGQCTWVGNDPGGRGNMTGGAGAFAIADSDACG
ncbi:MAG: S8 family serine peptidase, partial [Anaerolineae bacterium]|nr:S8 family serine peptidase [Anaerolineae bacterium]